VYKLLPEITLRGTSLLIELTILNNYSPSCWRKCSCLYNNAITICFKCKSKIKFYEIDYM